MQAKSNAKFTEQEFIKGKNDAVGLLNLTNAQKGQSEIVWKTEKEELARINIEQNEEIAPVIYKSEIEFRKILTSDQLTEYKKLAYDSKINRYFLDDHSLGELKRIYKKKFFL